MLCVFPLSIVLSILVSPFLLLDDCIRFLRGERGVPELKSDFSEETRKHLLEVWRSMCVVGEDGDLSIAKLRAVLDVCYLPGSYELFITASKAGLLEPDERSNLIADLNSSDTEQREAANLKVENLIRDIDLLDIVDFRKRRWSR